MKFIFILCFSFLNCLSANFTLKAAEKINIKFEGMSIPISIDELSKLDSFENDSTEIIDWFRNNGLEKIFQLSKYLEVPVFDQDGLSKQILRSWMGRKVLSELSNTFIVPNDTNGIKIFNTIEKLLEQQREVTLLDILKEIPIYEINLDIENLIIVLSYWKKALEEQQNLTRKLNLLEKKNYNSNFNLNNEKELNTISRQISLNVKHRDNPLLLEIWIPEINHKKDLIIFMPGLGGDISNFRWLSSGLSKRGWPVLFINHEGSNSEALKASIKDNVSLPGGADIFLYRIKDLNSVLDAHKKGHFGLKNKSYILMGHSLGSLISILYEGNPPKKDLESRCENALIDFAITNLSKLLQCQLLEIPIPEIKKPTDLKGIVGFNSFGSLIWPTKKSSGIKVPVLFIGGTFDLITPLLNEQFNVFLASNSNKLSRFLIIDGASHFSPIRVINESSKIKSDDDVFKIKEDFVGINPNNFQNLSLSIIVQFLRDLNQKKGLNIIQKSNKENLYFHLLGEKEFREILKN